MMLSRLRCKNEIAMLSKHIDRICISLLVGGFAAILIAVTGYYLGYPSKNWPDGVVEATVWIFSIAAYLWQHFKSKRDKQQP